MGISCPVVAGFSVSGAEYLIGIGFTVITLAFLPYLGLIGIGMSLPLWIDLQLQTISSSIP